MKIKYIFNKEKYKKFFIICLIIFTTIFPFTALAEVNTNEIFKIVTIDTFIEYVEVFIRKYSFDCYKDLYSNTLIQQICKDINDFSVNNDIWDNITSFGTGITTIATVLVGLFFILGLFDLATSDADFKSIIMFLLKFLIAKTLVENSYEIISLVYDCCVYYFNQISSFTTGQGIIIKFTQDIGNWDDLMQKAFNVWNYNDKMSLYTSDNCLSIVQCLLIVGRCGFGKVLTDFVIVFVKFLLYTRLLELLLKTLISPVAFANTFAKTNGKTEAVKYFKKILVIIFQIISIVLILIFATKLSTSLGFSNIETVDVTHIMDNVNSRNDIFITIVMNVSILMLVSQSQNYIRDCIPD